MNLPHTPSFLVLVFSFLNLLSSTAQPVFLNTPASLHPLPLVYTGNVPELYLPGEAPSRLHIKTHLVEVALGINASANDLLLAIKEKGRAEGVDGIILKDFGQRLMGASGGVASLTGIGIKFMDSIHYMEFLIRQRVVAITNPDGKTAPTVIVNYDWRGNYRDAMDRAGREFYTDSILPFDAHLLLALRPPMFQYSYDQEKKLSRIRWELNQHSGKTITWIPRDNLSEEDIAIKVGDEANVPARFQMQQKMDKNLLTGAIIRQKKEPIFYLYYQYDSKGRIIAEKWDRLINGKAVPWLAIENRFYDNDPASWPHQ
jgi:hypothetical protein